MRSPALSLGPVALPLALLLALGGGGCSRHHAISFSDTRDLSADDAPDTRAADGGLTDRAADDGPTDLTDAHVPIDAIPEIEVFLPDDGPDLPDVQPDFGSEDLWGEELTEVEEDADCGDGCASVCGECESGFSCVDNLCTPAGCEGPLAFADAELEIVVRIAAGKPEGEIFYADVAAVTVVDFDFHPGHRF